MNNQERNLIYWRLIDNWDKYEGLEPVYIKKSLDRKFCKKFTVNPIESPSYIVQLLITSISEKNESDLELLIGLSEHFEITRYIDEVIAPLIIQPWHHFHDRIASILEFDKNEKTVKYLYRGALYSCDNLEYESDYFGFNRKCLYALAKIGTREAIDYIKKVSICDNPVVSTYAKHILVEFDFKV